MREGQREYFLQGLEDAFPGQGLRALLPPAWYGDRYWCCQPQGQTAVGGVLSQVRSVGHAVPYGADRLRSHPGLWGPAAELFLTENTEKERDR